MTGIAGPGSSDSSSKYQYYSCDLDEKIKVGDTMWVWIERNWKWIYVKFEKEINCSRDRKEVQGPASELYDQQEACDIRDALIPKYPSFHITAIPSVSQPNKYRVVILPPRTSVSPGSQSSPRIIQSPRPFPGTPNALPQPSPSHLQLLTLPGPLHDSSQALDAARVWIPLQDADREYIHSETFSQASISVKKDFAYRIINTPPKKPSTKRFFATPVATPVNDERAHLLNIIFGTLQASTSPDDIRLRDEISQVLNPLLKKERLAQQRLSTTSTVRERNLSAPAQSNLQVAQEPVPPVRDSSNPLPAGAAKESGQVVGD